MTADLPEVIVTERLTLACRRADAPTAVILSIRTTADGETIGEGRLEALGEGDWRLDLHVEPASRGHGFGREAARAMLALAFSEVGATRVVTEIPLENEGAMRLAEHLGMNGQGVEDGLRRYMAWRAPGATPPRRRRR